MKKIVLVVLLTLLCSVALGEQFGVKRTNPTASYWSGYGIPIGQASFRICTQTANDVTPSMGGYAVGGCNVLQLSDANTATANITSLDDVIIGYDALSDYGSLIWIVGMPVASNPSCIADGNDFQLEYQFCQPTGTDEPRVLVVQAMQAHAQGMVTISGAMTNHQTMSIGAIPTTVTAHDSGADGIDDFNIGGTTAQSATNMAAAINAGAEAGSLTAYVIGSTVLIEADVAGVAGNSLVLTTAMTNTTVNGSGTLGASRSGDGLLFVEVGRHNGIRYFDSQMLVEYGNLTDFPYAQMSIGQADTTAAAAWNIGLAVEALGVTATRDGVGIAGYGKAAGTANGVGIYSSAMVTATGDTGSAMAISANSTATHAGGANIGLYANVSGGATNYAVQINAGDINTIAATNWVLLDNSATALTWDSAGAANILGISTLDSEETVNVSGKETVTSVLDAGTGDEISMAINYSTNKASSGDSYGLKIRHTDTGTIPANAYLIDAGTVAAGSRFTIENDGDMTCNSAAAATWTGTFAYNGTAKGTLKAESANFEVSGSGVTPVEIQSQDLSTAFSTGNVSVFSGNSTNTGDYNSGSVALYSGISTTLGNTGNASVYSGDAADSSGDVALISGTSANSGEHSGNVDIYSGAQSHATGGVTGNVSMYTGQASGTAASGSVLIKTGAQVKVGDYASGDIDVYTGTSTGGDSGQVSVYTGVGALDSGDLDLHTGVSSGAASHSGTVYLYSGNQTSATGAKSGDVDIYSGDAAGTNESGTINIYTGARTLAGGTSDSGSVLIYTGATTNDGSSGDIVLKTGIAGAIESDAGSFIVQTHGTNTRYQIDGDADHASYAKTWGLRGLVDIAVGDFITVDTGAGVELGGVGVDQTFYSIAPKINQTTTSGYTALKINVTENAVGSGTKRLVSLQVGSAEKFGVSNTGVISGADADTISNDSAGAWKFWGTGSTSAEDLTWTYGATGDQVDVSSSTSVALVDFGTINLATDGLDLSDGNITNVGDIQLDSLTGDSTAGISIGGTGATSEERIAFVFGATSNNIDVSTSTSATDINFTALDINTTTEMSAENLVSTDDADINDTLVAGDIQIDEATGLLDFTGGTSGEIEVSTGNLILDVAGDSIVTPDNKDNLYVNIPITGTDAGTHIFGLQIDGVSIMDATATGNGAGTIGVITTNLGVTAGADVIHIGDANALVDITDAHWSVTEAGLISGENLASTDDADIADNLTCGDLIVDEATGVISFTGNSSATISTTSVDLTLDPAGNDVDFGADDNPVDANIHSGGEFRAYDASDDFSFYCSVSNGTATWDCTGDLDISGSIAAGSMSMSGDIDMNQNDLIDAASVVVATAKGGLGTITTASQTLTFAGGGGDASKVTSGLIPDGVTLHAVMGRVVTAGTTCTSMDIGDGTDVDIFGDNVAIADTTTFTPANATANWSNPMLAASEVTITGVGGNCVNLVVNVVAVYTVYTAPTID